MVSGDNNPPFLRHFGHWREGSNSQKKANEEHMCKLTFIGKEEEEEGMEAVGRHSWELADRTRRANCIVIDHALGVKV